MYGLLNVSYLTWSFHRLCAWFAAHIEAQKKYLCTFVDMEKKWEEIYWFISAGYYPSEYDMAQRQNLRRFASKCTLKSQ